MLKNISPILSPELVKTMMEMGHGDEIVLGDCNFPAASLAQRLIHADGHGISALLEAMLTLFPLDHFIECPAALMAVVPGDNVQPTVWETYRQIIRKSGETFTDFEMMERFAFYERTKKAFAVVATSESAFYGNIILKKGVVKL